MLDFPVRTRSTTNTISLGTVCLEDPNSMKNTFLRIRKFSSDGPYLRTSDSLTSCNPINWISRTSRDAKRCHCMATIRNLAVDSDTVYVIQLRSDNSEFGKYRIVVSEDSPIGL